jgi:conjugal transfer mating pair stabilization protein TraN
MGSRCLKDIQGTCVNWEQTFKCPQDVLPQKQKHTFKPLQFQASEEGPVFQENTELGQAMAQLDVLNKVQGEIKGAGGSDLPLNIFKGTLNRCTMAFANFKNCCAKEKGWGLRLNLSGCSGEDQQTNQKVSARKCVDLGQYCAEKILGVCIRKKRTHCCFDTKLARVLHEQGRRFGWGSAEKPNCRGFTIQELTALQFDAINFSEVFEDVLSSMTPPQATTVNRNLSDRLTQMTSSVGNRSGGTH